MIRAIVSALSAIGQAFARLFDWLRDKRLIRAGRDAERAENAENVLDDVARASRARADAGADAERLRRKFERKD